MTADLSKAWAQLRAEQPKLRIRDAAKVLNVSELELALLEPGTELLVHQPHVLLGSMHKVGKIMALTRNEAAVHEVKGTCGELRGGEQGGLMLGEIDTRLFFKRWAYTLYINQGERQSIQFFDGCGDAIHKVFATKQTNLDAWHELVDEHRSANPLMFEKHAKPRPEPLADTTNVDVLRQEWRAITDVHQFMALLKRHNISRLRAFELAGREFARQADVGKLVSLFEAIRDSSQEIMIFCHNQGLVQIYSGRLSKLVAMGDWYNVLDPDFNLHLNLSLVSQVWTSVRPSADGDIHCVDLFDANGGQLLQIFSRRSEGNSEPTFWSPLINQVLHGA
ncbi:hemin-degrading factor [Salinibius halmophilus]|uniref:hemin-degrading factor n=1 Tax=Salinibius halmophilus TaxID=1853216 RepID=UPI001314397C|nr:ChuX/HutX family heme-like substrate-binding protein [Salinibius halmophilus]